MAIQGSQQSWVGTGGPRFVQRPAHRRWLLGQAMGLLDFFHYRAFNPAGGFSPLDDAGLPFPAKDGRGVERQIHDTTRTVHCFAIAHLLGLPGADRMIDHGMDFLWKRHRDADRGGYFWGVDDEKATNPTKQAYGHAFVLLAASSAKVVGHPDADRLLADVSDVLNNRFWEADVGATSEEYAADWSPLGNYRGQNSNMHLTEALMAAYEATDDRAYLAMAESIARDGRAHQLPFHFPRIGIAAPLSVAENIFTETPRHVGNLVHRRINRGALGKRGEIARRCTAKTGEAFHKFRRVDVNIARPPVMAQRPDNLQAERARSLDTRLDRRKIKSPLRFRQTPANAFAHGPNAELVEQTVVIVSALCVPCRMIQRQRCVRLIDMVRAFIAGHPIGEEGVSWCRQDHFFRVSK